MNRESRLDIIRERADDAVRGWYRDIFASPTGIPDKLADWGVLDFNMFIDDKWVLNLGCSYPWDEIALAPRSRGWVAIDYVTSMIISCVTRFELPHWSSIRWVVADMRELPFASASFDTVFDFSSSDQVPIRRELVRPEVFRVLKPGGWHVMTYANAQYSPVRERFGQHGYDLFLDPSEVVEECVAAGFLFKEIRSRADLVPRERAAVIARKSPHVL